MKELNKAIKEDASVFEYDEVYDSMMEKKNSGQSEMAKLDSKQQVTTFFYILLLLFIFNILIY